VLGIAGDEAPLGETGGVVSRGDAKVDAIDEVGIGSGVGLPRLERGVIGVWVLSSASAGADAVTPTASLIADGFEGLRWFGVSLPFVLDAFVFDFSAVGGLK
jgi:hypothetical protein